MKLEKGAPEGTPFAPVVQKSTITQGKVIQSLEEPGGILKKTPMTSSWKGQGELEPARILEVYACYLLFPTLSSIYEHKHVVPSAFLGNN